MLHPKHKGIVFVKRDGLDLYSEETGRIYTFGFPPALFADLEIIHQDELEKQLKDFIDKNKIHPVNLAIILAENILLKKEFAQPQLQQQDEAVQKFLEIAPFENMAVKIFHLDKVSEVIVINKNIYLCLKEIFEKYGFVVSVAALSSFFFGKNALLMNGLNSQTAGQIIKKFDSVRQENLLEKQTFEEKPKVTIGVNSQAKKNKSSLPLLLLVFILLLLVLAFFYLKTQVKLPLPIKQLVSPTPVAIQTTVSSPEPTQPISTESSTTE